MIICQTCNRKYIYNKKQGHTTTRCNSCVVNIRRFAIKIKAITYKGSKCLLCGYNKCLQALTFHHINPKEKSFDISGNHCKKWDTIQLELDKCILLCCNCHAETENGLHPELIINEA